MRIKEVGQKVKYIGPPIKIFEGGYISNGSVGEVVMINRTWDRRPQYKVRFNNIEVYFCSAYDSPDRLTKNLIPYDSWIKL